MASVFSSISYGAGFAIIEQSVTGLGRAFAGSAAVAEDASTIFFNPAGLVYLDRAEMDAAINYIAPKSEFNDDSSTVTGSDGGDAGNNALVPNFYYARPINDTTVFGLGISAPFGLVTEYDDDWQGRYHAIKSDLMTININPSLAFKTTDKLSVGFGLSLQYIDLEMTQAVDFGTLCAIAPGGPYACANPKNNDGKAKFTADDWGWGFNLGLIYQVTEATRLAMSYRSKISHHLTGKGKFYVPNDAVTQAVATASGFTNAAISGDVDLPETASFAIHHQLNEKWAVMGDASWTRWSRFQELAINSPDPANKLNSTKEEKWDNSMRYGLGVTYAYNDKWTLRGGVAFDETPISDQYRTARIAGEDRKWIAIGASYKQSDKFTIDAGYTHIFISDPKIDETLSPIPHRLSGDFDASVDILGVQVRWFM
ncbi:MAG: outer membrane protein transport protein [Gammaproteobacteria bacterium]|nr:outer membrane protein transport protein [Gammaproteobacteria bacterium]